MLFLNNLLNTVVLAVGLLTAELALDSRTVSFESISIPASLASQGYTAEVAQQRITAAALSVVRDARTLAETHHVQSSNSDDPVELIARYLGVQPLLQVAQQAAGGLEYRIAADIVVERSALVLRMRASRYDGRVTSARVSRPPEEIEQLLADGGFMLMRLIDPHVACSAILRRSARAGTPDWDRTSRCVEASLPAAGPEDRTWLYNLLGVTRVLRHDRAGALTAFRSALEIEANFSPSLLNIGILLAGANRHEDAIRAYRTVFRHRTYGDSLQTYAATHTMMAVSLERLGRPQEALEQLRQAIRAVPDYLPPYLMLLERLPEGSREALAVRRAMAQIQTRTAQEGQADIFTENLLGMMPLSALLN